MEADEVVNEVLYIPIFLNVMPYQMSLLRFKQGDYKKIIVLPIKYVVLYFIHFHN